jgi:hypothetical protein
LVVITRDCVWHSKGSSRLQLGVATFKQCRFALAAGVTSLLPLLEPGEGRQGIKRNRSVSCPCYSSRLLFFSTAL